MDEHLDRTAQNGTSESLLVGRHRELTALKSCLAGASEGVGKLVLIGGDAGIGKSSVVEQFLLEASVIKSIILRGYSYDLEVTPPFGPWRQILRTAQRFEPIGPLLELLTRAGSEQVISGFQDVESGLENFLKRLSRGGLPVLVLEDMHWSDVASLDLLRHISRTVDEHRLLIIATYRDSELGPDQPLFSRLPMLVREARPLRITLRSLDRDQVDELVARQFQLSEADRIRLVDYVHSRGEGNPFFSNELLDTLVSQGSLKPSGDRWILGELNSISVPPLVRQVTEGRLRYLSDHTRELLGIASVFGMEARIDSIAEVLGVNAADIEDAIDEAQSAHLIELLTDRPVLRFRHGLTRQAVYEAQSMGLRRQWHHACGEMLSRQESAFPADVARHYVAARSPEAILWLIRAGNHAAVLRVPDIAIEMLTLAITMASEMGLPTPVEALIARGRAHTIAWNTELAERDLQQALDHATRTEPPDLVGQWHALLQLAYLWGYQDYDQAGGYFEQLCEVSAKIDDPLFAARMHIWRGYWHVNMGRIDQAAEPQRSALALFESASDLPSATAAANLLSTTYLILGDMQQAFSLARRGSEVAVSVHDLHQEVAGLINCAAASGIYEFATEQPASNAIHARDDIAIADQAITVAEASGWRSHEAFARQVASTYWGLRGMYGRAHSEGERSIKMADDIGHRQWMLLARVSMGYLLLDLLDIDGAIATLGQAQSLAQETRSILDARLVAAPLARAFAAAGQIERALSVLDDQLGDSADMLGADLRGCWYAMGEVELAMGNAAESLATVNRISDAAPRNNPELSIPALDYLKARALLAMDDRVAAAKAIAAGIQAAELYGFRSLLWRLLALDAKLDGNTFGNTAGKTIHFRRILTECSSTLPAGPRRTQFEQSANSFAGMPSGSSHTLGLSPREIDVLRLVAGGLTNPQIADRLFVSPRTVKGHLESIYTKLDVSSRTAAATKARESGLF